MLFNSTDFLIFFPIVTIIYFIIPDRIKYLWLLAAGYYLYMCWNIKYAVLFFGTSHVNNAVFPMELWKDYGITAYNFGGHANAIATSYWVMKNALDYTHPKLVVFDCLGMTSNTKTTPANGIPFLKCFHTIVAV